MRRLLTALALGAALAAAPATAAPLMAQETFPPLPDSLLPVSEVGANATLELAAVVFDNYFQAPPDQPDSTLVAGSMRLRIREETREELGGELFLEGRATIFRDFDASYGAGAGVGVERWWQRLEVQGNYDFRRPRLDVGDSVGWADVGAAQARYALRMGRVLELSAEGSVRRERFVSEGAEGEDDHRDHTFREATVAARTRVLGRLLSPEVGVVHGRPHGWEPAQTYVRREAYLRIRSLPAPWLYLSARYRVRRREYPDAPTGSSNFERTDTRRELSATADLSLASDVSLTVHHTRQDARSSREYRAFRNGRFIVGLALDTR